MMTLIMMMHRRWFGMKTDKDMETLSVLVVLTPLGQSGPSLTAADRRTS